MKTVQEKINEMKSRKALYLSGTSDEKNKAQHNQGKMLARERLHLLYDGGWYDELFTFAEHTSTSFGLAGKKLPGDGVVTGLGAINGRLVHVASQDFTVMGGSVGEMHAWKICELMDMALKNGTPFISINDSGGARIQEGVLSLRGYGKIFYYNTLLSGVVPQISIIAGPCAGGAAYSPALMDFVIMVQGTGQMFIAGPSVIKQATGEDISAEELGGAMTQATISGNVHFIARDDSDAIEICQKLLTYLPSNNTQDPPMTGDSEILIIEDETLNHVIPDDPRDPYNMWEVLTRIFDPDSFLDRKSVV